MSVPANRCICSRYVTSPASASDWSRFLMVSSRALVSRPDRPRICAVISGAKSGESLPTVSPMILLLRSVHALRASVLAIWPDATPDPISSPRSASPFWMSAVAFSDAICSARRACLSASRSASWRAFSSRRRSSACCCALPRSAMAISSFWRFSPMLNAVLPRFCRACDTPPSTLPAVGVRPACGTACPKSPRGMRATVSPPSRWRSSCRPTA